MAAAHLAYPDLAVDKFSGSDLNQDAESFIQLIERKINFALGDAPGDAGELANYTFRKKALFSSLLRGPAAEWYESNITNATTWEDRMFEQPSSLDFQMDETNFDTEWKWNLVLEEMQKKFGTSYTVSNGQLTRAGPMIWTVLRPLNKMQNEQHKADKGDRGTWTTVCEDLDLDISNGKLKSIWWSVQTPRGTISVPR